MNFKEQGQENSSLMGEFATDLCRIWRWKWFCAGMKIEDATDTAERPLRARSSHSQ
jgi:hypothetical protein